MTAHLIQYVCVRASFHTREPKPLIAHRIVRPAPRPGRNVVVAESGSLAGAVGPGLPAAGMADSGCPAKDLPVGPRLWQPPGSHDPQSPLSARQSWQSAGDSDCHIDGSESDCRLSRAVRVRPSR